MKNILISIIWIILAISFCFNILNAQKDNTDKFISSDFKFDNIPAEYYTFKDNTDIYRYIIWEYPDKIIIQKDVRKYEVIKGSTVNPNLFWTSEVNAQMYLNSKPKYIFKSSVNSDIPLELFAYDLSSNQDNIIKNSKFDTLYSVTDKDGLSVWNALSNSRNRDKVLDAFKLNNNYMVLSVVSNTDEIDSRVNENIFVDFTADKEIDKKPVIYRYSLPMYYFCSNHSGIVIPLPTSGKIINDNIIRLKYADGSIEHWKIKLTDKDIEKTKKVNPNNEIDQRLVWWNGNGKGSYLKGMSKDDAKSWDYNEESTSEPTY